MCRISLAIFNISVCQVAVACPYVEQYNVKEPINCIIDSLRSRCYKTFVYKMLNILYNFDRERFLPICRVNDFQIADIISPSMILSFFCMLMCCAILTYILSCFGDHRELVCCSLVANPYGLNFGSNW